MHRSVVRLVLLAAAFSTFVIGCGSGSSSASKSSPSLGSGDAGASPSADGSPSGDDASPPDGAPAEAGTPAVTCSAYCAAVAKNCTTSNTQYVSPAQCMKECTMLDGGTYGDSNNTLGCREAHADTAGTEVTTDSAQFDCFAAGPFGGGSCGERCQSFCSQIVQRCTGNAKVYDTVTQCLGDCGTKFEIDAAQNEYTDAGNTLNCREYWLYEALDPAASASDLATRCANAGPSSVACR